MIITHTLVTSTSNPNESTMFSLVASFVTLVLVLVTGAWFMCKGKKTAIPSPETATIETDDDVIKSYITLYDVEMRDNRRERCVRIILKLADAKYIPQTNWEEYERIGTKEMVKLVEEELLRYHNKVPSLLLKWNNNPVELFQNILAWSKSQRRR